MQLPRLWRSLPCGGSPCATFLPGESRRRQARQQVCRQLSAKSERRAEPEYRILQAACCMWDRLMLIAYALLSSNHS